MICPNCSNIIDDDSNFCVKCGSNINFKLTSKDKVITIGRESDNIITIDDPYVSSYHAVIKIVGNSLVLEDLKSTNGTFVNDKKIIIYNIVKGDRITFGKSAEFDWDDFYSLLSPEKFEGYTDRDSVYDNKIIISQPESGIVSKSRLPVKRSDDEINRQKEKIKSSEKKQIANLKSEVSISKIRGFPDVCPACGSNRITKFTQYKKSKEVKVVKGGGGGSGCTNCLLLLILFVLAPGLVIIFLLVTGVAMAGLGALVYTYRVPLLIFVAVIIVTSVVVAIHQSKLYICEKCGNKFKY